MGLFCNFQILEHEKKDQQGFPKIELPPKIDYFGTKETRCRKLFKKKNKTKKMNTCQLILYQNLLYKFPASPPVPKKFLNR